MITRIEIEEEFRGFMEGSYPGMDHNSRQFHESRKVYLAGMMAAVTWNGMEGRSYEFALIIKSMAEEIIRKERKKHDDNTTAPDGS